MGWSRQYFACPFVFQQGTQGYYCLICGCVIYGYAAFSNHIHGKRHTASVEQYGCDISALKDDYYYCKRCDCVVPYYTNVFSHIMGKRHQCLLYPKSQTIDWSSCDYFVCPFVSREGIEKYYCLICGCYMFSHTAFQSHIHGKLHAIAVETFGCDISPLGEDYYYCTQCDCNIPHYKNVYDHIVGQRHQNLLYERNEQDNGDSGNEEMEEQRVESTVSMEITEAPKSPILSRNFFELIIGQQNCELNEGDNPDAGKETEEQRMESAVSSEIAESPKLLILSEDYFELIIGQQNLLCERNERDNREAGKEEAEEQSEENEITSKIMEGTKSALLAEKVSQFPGQSKDFVKENIATDFSVHQISNDLWQHSYDSSSQSTLYEPIVIKNTTDYKRKKVSDEEKKPKKLEQVLFHNYTILSRPVDNEIKDNNKKDFRWKKIPHKVEPPIRLNQSSWQLSSCKNFLQNSHVKNEAKNSTCKNLTNNVEIPTQRDTSSNASDLKTIGTKVESLTNTQLSSKNNVPPKLIKQLRLVKKAEDNVSSEQISPEFSQMNGEKLRANSTGSSACLNVDINGNDNSNDTLKNQPEDRDVAELILTSKINDFMNADPMIYEVDLNMNDLSSTPASLSVSSVSIDEDSSPRRSSLSPKRKTYPKQSSKKIAVQKVVNTSDSVEDIYDMNDKKRAIKLGMKLSFVIDSKNIYCLICYKVLEADEKTYVEHLADIDHCEYLEEKKKDHALFELLSGEFSELYLAHQYMVEMSQDTVHCIICDKGISNVNYSLQKHIEEDVHRRRREEMHKKAKQCFELVKSRTHCDWYKIQKYRCVPCSANFYSEIKFVEHLESTEHANVTKTLENSKRELIYDFCTICALLWYGYRCTYRHHCDSSRHEWFTLQAQYESIELSESAKKLLATSEEYVEKTTKYLDNVLVEEEKNNETLIGDLENAVKLIFPRAKAYVFGSRLSGLASPDEDIDIFLDCENMYDEKISSHQILHFIKIVHKSLSDDPSTWDAEELESSCRSHTIRVHHRGTGLSCRISFENGLAVENSKLITSLINNFAMCRELSLFLKQWLEFCHLSGSEGITSFALYWLVIFYLQKESMLPSVARLIAIEDKSHIIAGWEVGVRHDYDPVKAETTIDIKELLVRFFTFYTNFDFRYDVACPLLGEVVKKQTFTDLQNLPRAMEPYRVYMESSDFPEPFRIDAVMCVQDPFHLRDNLTEAVSKAYLNRFRTCCSKSLLLLCSIQM